MQMNQVLFKSMQKNIKKYQNIQTKPKYSNKTKVSKVCKSMQKYLYGKKKVWYIQEDMSISFMIMISQFHRAF